jgi:hypothetical protein
VALRERKKYSRIAGESEFSERRTTYCEGKNSIILLKSAYSLPARPSRKRNMEVKKLGWSEAVA